MTPRMSTWVDRLVAKLRGDGRPGGGGVGGRGLVGGGSRIESRRSALEAAGSIVDGLPDAALILSADGIVLSKNAHVRPMIGPVVIGEHVARAARQPELNEAIRKAMKTGRPASFQMSLSAPAERHLDGIAAPLRGFGPDPSAPALLLVLQDISEREALARMRVEFVANASHELRTPLAALAGFIETLRGPAKDDPAARERFLVIMSEQAQRMTRLIDDLLLLSRVEMRVHLPPSAMADLAHVATEAIRIVSSGALKEGTTIVAEGCDSPVPFKGDHDELVQAVQNLLSNAIKYGKPGGTVVVRVGRTTDRRGPVLRLSVADDGPGIPAEHLPRLTERFYRVNTSASREKGGTGLGLAIVKHIAVRHGGRVEVESAPGKGTTFALAFPEQTGR